MAAQMVAVVVFGVMGAALAGRLGPRRVMLISDTARGPLVALVPVLHHWGLLPMPLFMAILFAVGAFFAPYVASQQAVLPALVGDDETMLSTANARLQGATRLTILLGPPLAGLLIAGLGAPVVLFLDAVSYLAAALLVRWGLPGHLVTRRQPDRGRLRDSLRVLVKNRMLTFWSLAQALGEMGWQAMFALIPVFALLRYDGSSALAGTLLGAFGGGALAGTLLVKPALRRVSSMRLAVVGRVGQGLLFLALLLPLNALGLAAFLCAVGLLNGISNAPMIAVRTTLIPERLRSMTLTVIAAFALSGGSLGLAVSGTAVESLGLSRTFTVLVVLQACGTLLFLLGLTAAPRTTRSGDRAGGQEQQAVSG
jgi:Arabinose efflux permease